MPNLNNILQSFGIKDDIDSIMSELSHYCIGKYYFTYDYERLNFSVSENNSLLSKTPRFCIYHNKELFINTCVHRLYFKGILSRYTSLYVSFISKKDWESYNNQKSGDVHELYKSEQDGIKIIVLDKSNNILRTIIRKD